MKILVLGAGGPVGRWICRCLSQRDDLDVYGRDDSEWNRHLMEVPEGVPQPHYASVDGVGEYPAHDYDLIYPAPSVLITKHAGEADYLTPPRDIVEICDDKALVAEMLGDLAPKTLWIRDTHGAGGKGSQMASEYLPGKNYAVEMAWKDGYLAAYFQKERISYSATTTSYNVTGTAAVARCIDDPDLLDLAKRALRIVWGNRDIDGIFTVDFKCDEFGTPKVTEINAGKFATSSYPFYFRSFNLPLLAVELALGLDHTPLGSYPEGLTVIRGYDAWPFIGIV